MAELGSSIVHGNLTVTGNFNRPTSIIAPTLINGWVNHSLTYNDAGYYKAGGRVYIKGMVKNGTLSSPIFILPPGYRPAERELIVVISNGALGRLDIATDGSVIPHSQSSNAWFSMDNISFAHKL